MGPGNYGLFPLHFLPIFLPHNSLFIREKDINIDNKSKLDNSQPPLLNWKLLHPQGLIIDAKYHNKSAENCLLVT